MKTKAISAMVLVILVLVAFAQVQTVQAQAGSYKAVLAGIDYPEKWERWHTDAQDLRTAMLTWDNWKPGNINLLGAGATAAQINNALAGQNVGPNDFFLFFYSGHGSYTQVQLDESVPPAIDECDETIAPIGGQKRDDDITDKLRAANFDPAATKLVVLDSCFSGGFWNGQDTIFLPLGDLERVPQTTLLASVPEDEYSPANSAFARALIAGATKGAGGWAPADTNKDRKITIKEWFDYANSTVDKSVHFTNRKQIAQKNCTIEDDFEEEVRCRTWPQYYYSDPSYNLVVFYDYTDVTVNAPAYVEETFTATIDVDSITDLNSGQFDLSFDASVVNVTDVEDGSLDGETIPVDRWEIIDGDTIRVILDVSGIVGVNGSGNLAKIRFEVVGMGGDRSVLDISDGMLVNTEAEEIPAEWIDDEIIVGPVKVEVNTPEMAKAGETFVASIDVDSIADFNAGLFDLSFDSSVVNVTDVADGRLDGTTIPVDKWEFVDEGTIRVFLNVPGITGVSGTENLAKISFEVVGKGGDRSILDISDGMLANNEAEEIPAVWIDDEVTLR